MLDLCDSEGQVKNLPYHKYEYASNLVAGRESYILLRVEREFYLLSLPNSIPTKPQYWKKK